MVEEEVEDMAEDAIHLWMKTRRRNPMINWQFNVLIARSMDILHMNVKAQRKSEMIRPMWL